MPLASREPDGSPPAVTFTTPNRGTGATETHGVGGAPEVRHTSAASGVSKTLHSFALRPRPRPRPRPTNRARAQRPEIYSLVLGFLGDVVQLGQTLLSRRLVLSLVNKALVSPSAGSQVFHFLQTPFSWHQLYARMEAGEKISWTTGGS